MEDKQNPLVIALGRFRDVERGRLSITAQEAELELLLGETHGEFAELLNREPKVIIVDGTTAELESICQAARAHPAGRGIPLIALTTDLDDAAFTRVLRAGGDDVVEFASVRPLLVRLRTARSTVRPPEPESRGLAIVVHSDPGSCQSRAQALEHAGFAVEFVLTPSEGILRARAGNPKLILFEAEQEGARAALHQSVRDNPEVLHVLSSPTAESAADARALEAHENAEVIDVSASADSVAFLVNELQKPGDSNRRRTRRVPYGTVVAFRGEKQDLRDYGFSHNLSAGGLYVRTLVPPEENTVWVELRPPNVSRWVHLEARVVWRRPYGPLGGATVPPGFGVQLTDATSRSMEGWLDGYIGLVDALHSTVKSERQERDEADSPESL